MNIFQKTPTFASRHPERMTEKKVQFFPPCLCDLLREKKFFSGLTKWQCHAALASNSDPPIKSNFNIHLFGNRTDMRNGRRERFCRHMFEPYWNIRVQFISPLKISPKINHALSPDYLIDMEG